jgi:predicted dehydrogenase
MNSSRKMKVGMVGGGSASFFGAPHRRAILMDNSAELTAGALRSHPDHSVAAARELYFTRGYPDWKSLLEKESCLPEDERIDYLTIVTPNDAHYGPAAAAAEVGLGVLCEKPLTTTLDEARRLLAIVLTQEIPFTVAHTYTGYPMVMLARELVRNGDIGEIRKVEAWYPQGWLATRREDEGHKQAAWRVDPAKAGASGCGGDIGTHAYQFVLFVTGLHAVRLLSRMKSIVPGRPLDDDFTVLAELNNGAQATITASQVTIGAQNDNGFRVIGTAGTLVWKHTHFEVLEHYIMDQPVRLYRQGADYSYFPGSIRPYLRLPAGHPEGFHEALANLHRTLEWTIRRDRGEPAPRPFGHPGIADGVSGMAFLEAALQSSRAGAWVDVPR